MLMVTAALISCKQKTVLVSVSSTIFLWRFASKLLTDVECESGKIRLVGGVTDSVGRLEVCGNGVWGGVCNYLQYWGPDNARVVCHQLGFSDEGIIKLYYMKHSSLCC